MGPSCDPSGRTEVRSWIDQGLKLGMVGICSLDIVEFPVQFFQMHLLGKDLEGA